MLSYQCVQLYRSANAASLKVLGFIPDARIITHSPPEHSHEQFLTTVRTNLNLDNPDQIQDPVFGLLGNAAASVSQYASDCWVVLMSHSLQAGQGKITDTDCLQTATADRAFTNAKAAGDVDGQVAALIYRALERNTGTVGLASVACTSFKPVNPEIAAISQHQVDPGLLLCA